MKKVITTTALIMLMTTLSLTQANAQNIVKTMKSGNWSDQTIWSTGIVPTANDNVIIVDSIQVVMNISTINCKDLSIGQGAVLNAYNTGTLNVSGNWYKIGTFIDNNSTVIFNGSLAQLIDGKGTTFNNLAISNSMGVTASSDVSIKGELQLKVGKLTNNAKNFILLSDANRTARIAPLNSAVSSFSGNMTVQRFINASRSDWRFFGPAVIGDTVRHLNNSFPTYGFIGATYPNANFNSIVYYDESIAGPSSIGFIYTLNGNSAFKNGLGYKCRIDSGSRVVSVTGQPAVGNQTFNITYTSYGDTLNDGWNLIANPYASSIDWNSTNWNKSGISSAISIWNSNLQQYATYKNGIGTNGGTNIIPSSQAFWIQTNKVNPILSCTEDIKVADNGTYLRTAAPSVTVNNIVLGLSGTNNTSLSDETIINFLSNASTAYDENEDATKMFSLNAEAPSISSVAAKYDLSINSVPTTVLNQDIPIRVKVGVPGIYSIKHTLNMLIVPFSCMILEDLVTKSKIDLTTAASYSFNITDTTEAPRFMLHLSSTPTGTIAASKTIGVDPTCSYRANGKGIVKVTKSSGSVSYTWRTLHGNTLAVHTSEFDSDTLYNLSPGKYVVNVTGIINACGVNIPMVIDTVIVNGNQMRIVSKINHNDTKNVTGGSIDAEVKGGKAPYKFQWANNEATSNLKNLSGGTYTLYTIDANGCVDTSVHVVNMDQALASSVENRMQGNTVKSVYDPSKIKFIVYPNPNSGEFTVDISGLENSHDVTITLTDEKGASVYESSFNIMDESSIQTKIVPESKLNNGVYFCTLSTEGIKQTVKVIVN